VDATFNGVDPDPEHPLAIDDIEADGHATLALRGELDPHTAPLLQERIDAIFASGRTDLCLDLSGLSFIDSSGLRVILSAHKRADDRGGRLVLRSPSPTARRLLVITGLLDHIEVSR
jgi:anti-sigma B factor antagonist